MLGHEVKIFTLDINVAAPWTLPQTNGRNICPPSYAPVWTYVGGHNMSG